MKKYIFSMCMVVALLGVSLPAMSMSVQPVLPQVETAFNYGFAMGTPIAVATSAPMVVDNITPIVVDALAPIAVAASTGYLRQGLNVVGRNVKALARSLVFEHPYVSGVLATAVLAYTFRTKCHSLLDKLLFNRTKCRSLLDNIFSQTRFAKWASSVTQVVSLTGSKVNSGSSAEPSHVNTSEPIESPSQASTSQPMENSSQASTSQPVESHFRISFSGAATQQSAILIPGEIYQVRSVRQKEAECGCYAKYNALAVAALLENNEIISPQAIKKAVTELVAQGGVANWVDETTVFADLAASLPAHNVYMLKVGQSDNGQEMHVVPAGATPDQDALSMDDFWTTVRDQAAESVGYFIVNLDYPAELNDDGSTNTHTGHWVLIVALKKAGQKGPAFLYFDSQNMPIKTSPYAKFLIPYFREQALDEQR